LSYREKNEKSQERHGWPIFRLQLTCFCVPSFQDLFKKFVFRLVQNSTLDFSEHGRARFWQRQARGFLTRTTHLKKHSNGMYK